MWEIVRKCETYGNLWRQPIAGLAADHTRLSLLPTVFPHSAFSMTYILLSHREVNLNSNNKRAEICRAFYCDTKAVLHCVRQNKV